MSNYIFRGLLGLVLLGWLPLSFAEGVFDGSRPLVCAAIHAAECSSAELQCKSGPPWMIDFPVFVEIDFAAKTASTTRQHVVARVSKIELLTHLPGNRMSIQGADGEYSWSMLISEETGSMTLAVAGEEVGFMVLGACTPR